MDRRTFLQSSSVFALQSLGLVGCSVSKRPGAVAVSNATAPNLAPPSPFYDFSRAHHSHPRRSGSYLPYHRLPAAVSRCGPAPGRGAGRRQSGRSQLRPWRQWLVPLLGLRRCRRSPCYRSLSRFAGMCCSRLRRAGAHCGLNRAAHGAAGDDYAAERPPYVRSSRATGSWTPALSRCSHFRSRAGFRNSVGKNGPDLLRHVPDAILVLLERRSSGRTITIFATNPIRRLTMKSTTSRIPRPPR